MKKIALAAGAVALFAAVLLPGVASASSPVVAGTYSIADNGPGAWSGGPLFSDGTLGGGGGASFSTPGGRITAHVVSGSWVPGPDLGTITLTLNFVGVGQIAGATQTIVTELPVTGTPIKVGAPGPTTIIRVRLF